MNQPAKYTIVASHGRAGSSLLYRTILEARNHVFVPPQDRKFVRSISDLPNGVAMVLKTHDYPESITAPERTRVVFCFGDVIDAMKSLLRIGEAEGEPFLKAHFHHLVYSSLH